MRIGWIGLGNMATAMISGILQKKAAEPGDMMGYAPTPASRERARQQFGIQIAEGSAQAAAWADILFLAVKPGVLAEVIGEIQGAVRESTVIVSIAAGKSLAYLAAEFGGERRKIVRCMPNTPAMVSAGCTGVCAAEAVTEEELAQTLMLLRSFGTADLVPEHLMDVVTGVSGSSPAYVFLFIEAMADAAVAAGMPRKQAYAFAAQAVLGSAKMVLDTGKHPGELKDMVCSPGGTTIQAVKVLEEKGMRAAVMDAMAACIEKAGKL